MLIDVLILFNKIYYSNQLKKIKDLIGNGGSEDVQRTFRATGKTVVYWSSPLSKVSRKSPLITTVSAKAVSCRTMVSSITCERVT